MPKTTTTPLQLTLSPARSGRMGELPLGHDYMAGVKNRAKMLDQATRYPKKDHKK